MLRERIEIEQVDGQQDCGDAEQYPTFLCPMPVGRTSAGS